MTYEMLAEEQEMLARARHSLAQAMPSNRLRNAMHADAADAAGQARQFREQHNDGAMLVEPLATMLSIDPIPHPLPILPHDHQE